MEYDESYPEYPQSPEPIRSGSFTYGKDGFAAGGISREPLPELKLLFRKNASRARVGVANKTWVTAQLRLYGIPFQRTSSAAQLKATLEDAVRTGKVRSVGATWTLPRIWELRLYSEILTLFSAMLSSYRSLHLKDHYQKSISSG